MRMAWLCGELRPQLTAFFTSAPILASSAAVNCFNAKAVGHRAPSSRFALSLKPNVAYLVLNFFAHWKKQTTLSSLAYAGIPYQSFGERAGALALMIAWSRLPKARSGSRIAAIFASTALSPSVLSAFSSRARSFIATRSSSVNPLNVLPIAVVRLADFCVSFFGLIEALLQVVVGAAHRFGRRSWVDSQQSLTHARGRIPMLVCFAVLKTPHIATPRGM